MAGNALQIFQARNDIINLQDESAKWCLCTFVEPNEELLVYMPAMSTDKRNEFPVCCIKDDLSMKQ